MSDEETIQGKPAVTTAKETEVIIPKETPNATNTPTISSQESGGTSIKNDNNNNNEEPSSTFNLPKDPSQLPLNKKKEIIRPLFSRSSTNDKGIKPPVTNKNMIVETETVDASKVPSVTLPIASSSNVMNNELMSNNSSMSNNLASLRSKKSTLFVDQNNQSTQNATNTSQNQNNDDNDSISVNGSIRNINRKLNPSESHMNISKPGATKADLFAAKIANAVGDVSDSDSEETFVYESAPDAMNTSNTLPINKNSTLSGVISSGNPMALRKLSQRNISMPVMPSSNSQQPYSPTAASHILLVNEDSKEQANKSFDTEDESDLSNQNNTIIPNASSNSSQIEQGKFNLDTTVVNPDGTSNNNNNSNNNNDMNSINDKLIGSNLNPTSQSPVEESLNIHNNLTNASTNNFNNDNNSPINNANLNPNMSFTKYNGNRGSRKTSTTSLVRENRQNQLRTTTSKLFETKGSSLRRYSGVPDDINIEDYIDQYDEEHEIDGGDYADTYEYDDYEDEDELTPLNVHVADGNLRYNNSRNFYNKRKSQNFNSTDQGGYTQDFGDYKDISKSPLRHSSSRVLKNPRKVRKQVHQRQYSPHNFYNSKKNSKIQILKNFFYLFVLVLLLLVFGFVAGFLLATTKDLQGVDIVSIDDVLVSYDELVFDLQVQAFNPGFVTVEVSDIELDIFAKSSHLDDGDFYEPKYLDDSKSVQTLLLGSVSKFETPLEFAGGFFNRNHTISKAGIKLIHPGKNSTDHNDGDTNHKIDNDSDKWKNIINYPFDLIVRGSLKYTLPFFHTDRSIAVTKTVSIDVAELEKSRKHPAES